MKIYTRTGDKGTTSLVYGARVEKNHERVDAYGTCDEANSAIGLALSFIREDQSAEMLRIKKELHKVQTILFHAGAELATPPGKKVQWKLSQEHVHELEDAIDEWDESLRPLDQFILPGGHPAGAALHTARTVVRRAERLAVAVEGADPIVISYLNRLSDFLFVAARYVNQYFGITEEGLHKNSPNH